MGGPRSTATVHSMNDTRMGGYSQVSEVGKANRACKSLGLEQARKRVATHGSYR